MIVKNTEFLKITYNNKSGILYDPHYYLLYFLY